MTTLRVKFDGKVLVPEGPVNLPTDRVLEIDVRDDALQPGSPELLLRLMKTLPPVPAEDLKEMLTAIESEVQSADYRSIFEEDVADEDRQGQ